MNNLVNIAEFSKKNKPTKNILHEKQPYIIRE